MTPVNEAELDWTEIEEGKTNVRRKQFGAAAGGDHLGCSLYEIPPGGESWPYHYHTANEEALYVLRGTGTLRLDGERYRLEPGAYVPCPSGEAGGHAVANDSEDPLRDLAVSTMDDPDVTVYPDSGKLGVFVGSPPGGRGERSLHGYYRIDDDVDYWEE